MLRSTLPGSTRSRAAPCSRSWRAARPTSTAGPRRARRRCSPSRCSTTSPRTTRASGGCCSTCCPTLNPDWVERNPSDLGIALVELLAYEGDRLSYFQDAVANEAYLDTRAHPDLRPPARAADRLPDARRAERLGRRCTSPSTRPARSRAGRRSSRGSRRRCAARSRRPSRCSPRARSPSTPRARPGLARVVAFETATRTAFPGATTRSRSTPGATRSAACPPGHRGVPLRGASRRRRRSARCSRPATTSCSRRPRAALRRCRRRRPAHRQLVLIEAVDAGVTDPLYSDTLAGGRPTARERPADPRCRCCVCAGGAPTRSTSRCASRRGSPDGTLVRNVSVARGNIVLADHGLTTRRDRALRTTSPSTGGCSSRAAR